MTDTPGESPLVMMSCGEASGDLYAAALTRALKAERPATEVVGFGGPKLQAEGATLLGTYERLAVTGLSEAVRVLPQSLRMLAALRELARARRPGVFVAVDFPDFNFRLLPPLHRLGIPIVYYVSPQLWAWRPGRIEHIRRYVSKMLVIFPFEVPLYEGVGVPVEHVGHPLVELIPPAPDAHSFLRPLGLDPTRPVVGLLPGSRPNEIARILPVLVAAMPLVRRAVPAAQFVVARAPALPDHLFAGLAGRPGVAVVEAAADEVLAVSSVAVTASGTATVQAALHRCPMVVVYRLSALTYRLGRAFVRVPHFAMVNLIAGGRVVPELIQDDCTAESVSEEVVALLTDSGKADRMRADLDGVRTRLGGPGASIRAARAVLAAAGRP